MTRWICQIVCTRSWIYRIVLVDGEATVAVSASSCFSSNMASYKSRKDEERQFWKEFIAIYRSLPDLWKVNSVGYVDKYKREASYETLIEKMREFDPRADRASVCAKINSLRSTYRRELSKIKSARATGDEYVPTLWYFDDMSFLKDQRTPAVQHNDTDFIEENNESEVDEASSQASHHAFSWKRAHSTRNQPTIDESSTEREESKRAKLLCLACKRFTNPPSETELLVKSWLIDYEKLSADQQLYAKKFINDVLFEGQLGNLHRNAITFNSALQPIGNSHRAHWAHPQGYNPGPANESPPNSSRLHSHSNVSIRCDLLRGSSQEEQMERFESLEEPFKEEQLN
ncbi:uncharacterized protein LOC118463361 isoform X2 [Anopheles albimanus]|uniref:uncharacterized protein LOC118463361 isoform X2 n=1 Tax=Anopheles albimanus TaxID=7167 RepID=UPI001641D658|nr:uncharacterized protein LOC118463361 isoform X2 [Anopheles albimanus]